MLEINTFISDTKGTLFLYLYSKFGEFEVYHVFINNVLNVC